MKASSETAVSFKVNLFLLLKSQFEPRFFSWITAGGQTIPFPQHFFPPRVKVLLAFTILRVFSSYKNAKMLKA